jgi:hypothetical protein
LIGCIFNNGSSDYVGGLIYVCGNNSFTLCSITNGNCKYEHGGGVFVDGTMVYGPKDSYTTMTLCNFSNVTCGSNSGSLMLIGPAYISLCLWYECTSPSSYGGFVMKYYVFIFY